MKINSILKKSSFLIIIILGMLVGSMAFASVNYMLDQSKAPSPDYPINEFGETYGSALDAKGQEKEPDLIKAIGVDGTIGYVRATDLIGKAPNSPEEALEQQAKATETVINLYKNDGRTIIGKFIMKPGKETTDQVE